MLKRRKVKEQDQKYLKSSGSETVKAVVPEISSSDSETSSSSCVSSSDTSTVSDSDKSIIVKKRKSKLKNITKQGRTDSKYESRKRSTGITRLLEKIDSRQLPKLEKFSEESGQSLSAYLVKFENYCKESFRGPKDLWINELENHLKGGILDTFSSIRDFNDSYEDLKNKLLKSFNDNKEIRKKLYRQKFENARPKPKESMYMFSVRLEGLFKSAFPKHRTNTGSTLINQFKHAVPKSVRKMLKMQILACKLKDDKVNWSFVQQCVRLNDIEDQKSKQDSDTSVEIVKETQKEVLISLSETKENKITQRNLEKKNGNRTDGHSVECDRFDRGNRVYNNRKIYGANSGSRNLQGSLDHNEHSTDSNRVVFCNMCKKFGHLSLGCHSRIRCYFARGSLEHFIGNCPRRYDGQASSTINRSQNNNSNQGSQDYRSQSGRGNFSGNNRGNQRYNRNSSYDRSSYNRNSSNDRNTYYRNSSNDSRSHNRNHNYKDSGSRNSRENYRNDNRHIRNQSQSEHNANQAGNHGSGAYPASLIAAWGSWSGGGVGRCSESESIRPLWFGGLEFSQCLPLCVS